VSIGDGINSASMQNFNGAYKMHRTNNPVELAPILSGK